MSLVAMLCGCATTSTDGERIRVVAKYCESVSFEKTGLAVEHQVAALPKSVETSLKGLRNSGTTAHGKYLCYLLLREYEYQVQQFGGGYTLSPGLPPELIEELDRVLERAVALSGGSDRTSATYALAILRNPDVFATYPKGQELSGRIQRLLQRGGLHTPYERIDPNYLRIKSD